MNMVIPTELVVLLLLGLSRGGLGMPTNENSRFPDDLELRMADPNLAPAIRQQFQAVLDRRNRPEPSTMSTTPQMPRSDRRTPVFLQDLVNELFAQRLAPLFSPVALDGSETRNAVIEAPTDTTTTQAPTENPTVAPTENPTAAPTEAPPSTADRSLEAQSHTPADQSPKDQSTNDQPPNSVDQSPSSLPNPPSRAGPVAFSATISGDFNVSSGSAPISGADIVRFDDVATNDGDAYDGSTGLFTTDAAGTYIFTLDLKSAPGKMASARIVKNDKVLHYVRANGQTTGEIGIGSGTVACKLDVGDLVFVCVVYEDGITEVLPRVTRFTGFKLP